MPDKPLTIATYAAGASLAAITLVYVFGPTFMLDDEAAQSSRSTRKRGVVGLVNPANDCFINSVLQTLAGLPELRIYLIRELHRRKLDGKEIYSIVEQLEDEISPNESKDIVKMNETKEPSWKVLGLQQGLVTAGLKDILDALNERPIYKKTISARTFVSVMETAFRTRISRQQQDAQEFLQIVAERLSEEYHAGRNARRKAKSLKSPSTATLRSPDAEDDTKENGYSGRPNTLRPVESARGLQAKSEIEQIRQSVHQSPHAEDDDLQDDPGFPFEGKIEAQIECMTCHFKPKPSVSGFVTLTLNVPHHSSTTLNACFDGMLKVEHIDDYKCERCRLEHAIQVKTKELSRASDDQTRNLLTHEVTALEHALATDPEALPKNIKLPDPSLAPKRRISRHMRISGFPKVLAIHLSRSVWDPNSNSSKNMAKVSFPETLPLGGLLDQHSYRLLGVVTHKGGHNSGHYESFRRQYLAEPYSAKLSMGTQGMYSAQGTPRASGMPSPMLEPTTPGLTHSPSSSGNSTSSRSSSKKRFSLRHRQKTADGTSDEKSTVSSSSGAETPLPQQSHSPSKQASDPTTYQQTARTSSKAGKSLDLSRLKRKQRNQHNRWWRISDDKIKESKTSDVLGMQREVYLLFYEIMVPEV
ncbi:cysteine proteinase, partial [Aureobasidium melanogenum]